LPESNWRVWSTRDILKNWIWTYETVGIYEYCPWESVLLSVDSAFSDDDQKYDNADHFHKLQYGPVNVDKKRKGKVGIE
jgi:hypothetical protein